MFHAGAVVASSALLLQLLIVEGGEAGDRMDDVGPVLTGLTRPDEVEDAAIGLKVVEEPVSLMLLTPRALCPYP
jgi:hypothetical protein